MATGKWLDPNIPKAGWACINIDDLGYPAATCEMCEVQVIRYVHAMIHDAYPHQLECGCICAGYMEEDTQRARTRETTFKNYLARRQKWLTRPWHTQSWRNLEYLNANHCHVSVWPDQRGGYAALVEHRPTGQKRYSKRFYPTSDAAKLAAFDVFLRMSMI